MANGDFTLEKALTGAYITGVDPKTGLQPNVNAEGGEYILTPEGSVLEVWGDKHKQGGVNMILPSMTAVLSDTKDLTIKKSDVKKLESKYGLKGVKTTMTYSDVLDRYSRKIGRTKVVNEIEDYMKKIRQQSEKRSTDGMSNDTIDMNVRFIGEKIQELKTQADEKEGQMREMFIDMFTSQQKQKPNKGVSQEYAPQTEENQVVEQAPQNEQIRETEYIPTEGELSQTEVFELGGYVNDFKGLASKYGWTERKLYDTLKSKNMLPKFDGGGIVIDYGKNIYKGEERVKQSASTTAYGKVDAQKAIEELYKEFPLILKQDKYKGIISFGQNGNPKLKEGVNLNKVNDLMKDFQTTSNKQMISSAKRIVEDSTGLFTDAQKRQAQDYLDNETFLDDNSTVRGFDGKLGNFTSGRTALGLSLVTPEELKSLNSKGIYSYKQLINTPEELNNLSSTSIENVNKLREGLPEDADYRLSQYSSQAEIPGTSPNSSRTREGESIKDDLNLQARRNRIPKAYWNPDESVPPPSPLLPETLEQINLQRIDPIRVGIEPVLQRLGEERTFVARQLEGLPSSQRASVLANTVANAQKAESEAIMNATAQNAANFAAAEQYNIGKADQEEMANAQMRLNYEARVLRGLDNYEKDMFNYQMANRAIYLNQYQNQMNLNRLDQMFPDVSLDTFGIGYNYNPQGQFSFNKNEVDYNKVVQLLSQQYQSEEKKKKKTEKE